MAKTQKHVLTATESKALAMLKTANSAYESVTAKTIKAADFVVSVFKTKEYSTAKTAAAKVDLLCKNLGAEYSALNVNVRNIFRAAVMCALNPDAKIIVKQADKKNGAVIEKAGEAIKAGTITKHALIEAAKELRAKEGTANKTGQGRKPAKSAPKKSGLAVTFIADLQNALENPVLKVELLQVLKSAGYQLSVLSATKKAGAKKPAPVATIASMVSQVTEASKPAPTH